VSELVRIFTDGSAIGNPGSGGWAAIIQQGFKTRTLRGGNPYTCIAEMELTAALMALRSINKPSTVILYSDSELLIQGMKHLARRWSKEGWTNRRGKPLQYRSLWHELLDLNRCHSIKWQWIRGHNGHPEQQQADRMAYKQACAQRDINSVAA
jgi:ribonuclease HI